MRRGVGCGVGCGVWMYGGMYGELRRGVSSGEKRSGRVR